MPNAWQEHLSRFRSNHPGVPLKQCMQGASLTYRGKGKSRATSARGKSVASAPIKAAQTGSHIKGKTQARKNMQYFRGMTDEDDECSADTWAHIEGHCYIAAAFVLAAKVPCVRDKLQEPTRKLLGRKTTIGARFCKRIPDEIGELYKRGFKNYGNSFSLFDSILNFNNIERNWGVVKGLKWLPNSTDIDEEDFESHLNNFKKFEGFTDAYINERIDSSETGVLQMYEISMLQLMLRVHQFGDKLKSTKIKGGLINLLSSNKRDRDDTIMHSSHTVAFTMCNKKMLLCNWGKCTFDDNRTSKYIITRVALLIC